jgi:hypothetical protein
VRVHTAIPSGGLESSVFELASNTGDYRLLFWRNTSQAIALDLGAKACKMTHVDWWGMQLVPLGGVTGNISLSPPAGPDGIVQLLCD